MLLRNFAELQKQEMLLTAIWLNRKLRMPSGEYQIRITEGMEVSIQDGELVDSDGMATHKIIGCYGSIDSSNLYINVIDLQSLELSKIILKEE